MHSNRQHERTVHSYPPTHPQTGLWFVHYLEHHNSPHLRTTAFGNTLHPISPVPPYSRIPPYGRVPGSRQYLQPCKHSTQEDLLPKGNQTCFMATSRFLESLKLPAAKETDLRFVNILSCTLKSCCEVVLRVLRLHVLNNYNTFM